MNSNLKKEMVLKEMKNLMNVKTIQSKKYNVGEYAECLADDKENILWKKDNKKYSKGDDSKRYGSIKTDKATIIEDKSCKSEKELFDTYFKNVHSIKFTLIHFTKTEIEFIELNKKQFKEVVKRFAYYEEKRSKLRLNLSQKNINLIKYEILN